MDENNREENEALEKLINGHVEESEVIPDHWEHMMKLVGYLITEEQERNNKQMKEVFSKYPSQPDILFYLDIELKVIRSNLDLEDKKTILSLIEYKKENEEREYERLLQVFENKVKVGKHSEEIGRPNKGRAIFKWLDYLTVELGSINKAVLYAAKVPLVDLGKHQTLLREYRKYRNSR